MKKIKIHTSLGNVTLELSEEKAPQTVKNFMDYAKSGFYDNTIFHRVIKGFMVQGGGFEPGLQQKRPSYPPILNEAANGLKNKVGTIAMARTSEPHSASSQFFINVADNSSLDFQSETQMGYGYCVFGEIIEGIDIILNISMQQTGSSGMHQDVPTKEILVEKVECITSEKVKP